MKAKGVEKAVEILRDSTRREGIGIPSNYESDHVDAFYKFIADRLAGRVGGATSDNKDKQLVAMGYVLCIELALHDARNGVDGFRDNAPLRGRFVGLPKMMYSMMSMPLFEMKVVSHLFDEDFAEEVEVLRQEIEAEDRAASLKMMEAHDAPLLGD